MIVWPAIKKRFVKRPVIKFIPDATNTLSREQMTRFEEAIKEHEKEHEAEKRRSLEVTGGFFEKLAALNAGSIAVAASIIVAIMLKSDAHPDYKPVIHDILIVVVLLWLSLVLSLSHNFLAAYLANVDADYSDTEFTWAIFKQMMPFVQELQPQASAEAAKKVEDVMRKRWSPQKEKLVRIKHRLYPAVRIIGYIAIGVFLAAYTLVPIFLWKLW